jgi:hypothetical protein
MADWAGGTGAAVGTTPSTTAAAAATVAGPRAGAFDAGELRSVAAADQAHGSINQRRPMVNSECAHAG